MIAKHYRGTANWWNFESLYDANLNILLNMLAGEDNESLHVDVIGLFGDIKLLSVSLSIELLAMLAVVSSISSHVVGAACKTALFCTSSASDIEALYD